ncbi:MAG: lactate utilization protein B, partial [Bacteroidota bacterium]
LRELASRIKSHTLSKLDDYLVRFEKNALKNGVHVHWAANDKEHNQIVLEILKSVNAKKLVKSKSMLTEECGLNPVLEKHNFEVIDTDLGERIIQLRHEPPSHIVLPAIHLKKEEIGELFHEKLNTEEGNSDPTYLTAEARKHLRKKFLGADVALTGVNFGVAETGQVVVCTNEGNADMGVNLAPVQIHSMGIEKIIPQQEHLGIFTRLLARSATGQEITTYTSHYSAPRKGGQMHIILVDNGRSELMSGQFNNALKCIRCGACMNTCPIYRRSGGHSYGSLIPGPIGSVLAPIKNEKQHADLPFACTLCGSCTNVCPVKVDLDKNLYNFRQQITQDGNAPKFMNFSMKVAGKVLSKPFFYDVSGKFARFAVKYFPKFILYNKLNIWARKRELPEVPKYSFKEWYKKTY